PQDTGSLDLKVRLLDAGIAEQANLELSQDIVTLNPILEGVIASAGDQPGPGVGNPDVLRELVNDYSVYYQGVTLQTPETGDSFLNFLFSMVFDARPGGSPADQGISGEPAGHRRRKATRWSGPNSLSSHEQCAGELDTLYSCPR